MLQFAEFSSLQTHEQSNFFSGVSQKVATLTNFAPLRYCTTILVLHLWRSDAVVQKVAEVPSIPNA